MLKPDTREIQTKLAEYCRNGSETNIPGTTSGRLPQYRRLVFNVIKGTLDQAYPIAARHLGAESWLKLVSDFFADYPCSDPQVWKMPAELIDYVDASNYHDIIKKPYLKDLLKMEWLEIEIHSMPDIEQEPCLQLTNALHLPLSFNPHYTLSRFSYPVHKIHVTDPADSPGEYFMLIFRNNENFNVQYLQLQPVYAAILDTALANRGVTIAEARDAVLKQYSIDEIHVPDHELSSFVELLAEKGFVLGNWM
jgi:hypothetical protein